MNIIIIGCGRVGAKLAQLLSEEDHNVTIIDKNPSAFHRISDYFNGIKIVGNGFDLETLKKADIKNSDVFVVVTNGDNTNIMA